MNVYGEDKEDTELTWILIFSILKRNLGAKDK